MEYDLAMEAAMDKMEADGAEYARAEGFAFPAPSSDWGTVTHSMMVLPNPKRRWWSFWRPRHIVIKSTLLGDEATALVAGTILTVSHVDQDLKPCSYCGGVTYWQYTPFNEADGSGDDGTGWVECSACGIEIDYGSRDEAINAWNRRAQTLETKT